MKQVYGIIKKRVWLVIDKDMADRMWKAYHDIHGRYGIADDRLRLWYGVSVGVRRGIGAVESSSTDGVVNQLRDQIRERIQ